MFIVKYEELYHFWGTNEYRKIKTETGDYINLKYISDNEILKKVGSNNYYCEYQGEGILTVHCLEDNKVYIASYGLEGDNKNDLEITTLYFEFNEQK